MLHGGLGHSWTIGGQRESGSSVDEIGHLWSTLGQRDSVQLGARCATP